MGRRSSVASAAPIRAALRKPFWPVAEIDKNGGKGGGQQQGYGMDSAIIGAAVRMERIETR
jgi:hypothetical protein